MGTQASIKIVNTHAMNVVNKINLGVGCDGDAEGIALLLFNAIHAKTQPSQYMAETLIMSGAHLDVERFEDDGLNYTINEVQQTIVCKNNGNEYFNGKICDFINAYFVYHSSLPEDLMFSKCLTRDYMWNLATESIDQWAASLNDSHNHSKKHEHYNRLSQIEQMRKAIAEFETVLDRIGEKLPSTVTPIKADLNHIEFELNKD